MLVEAELEHELRGDVVLLVAGRVHREPLAVLLLSQQLHQVHLLLLRRQPIHVATPKSSVTLVRAQRRLFLL
jgi:hypothetical protein